MSAGDNRLGLIFEIAADPSKAEGALSEFAGRANAIEAELSAAKKSLAANQKNYNEALREGDAASREIVADMARERSAIASLSAELAEVKEQMKSLAEAEQGIGQASGGIRQSIAELRTFRMLMYSSLGLVSFGFYITEWAKVADAIKTASLAIGGFGSAAQKAFRADIKASDDALVHFHGLTTKLQIATGEFLLRQTQQRQLAAEAERAAAQKNLDFINGLLGPAGALLDLKDTYKRLIASNEEGNLHVLEQNQLAELAKLEKQLHAEQLKGAHAAEVAAHKRTMAAQHAERAAEIAFQKEYRAGHEFADKLARSFGKAYDARQRAEAKAAADLARGPQGVKGGIPGGSEGLGGLSLQIAAQTKLSEVLRKALPTEREIAIIRRQLVSLYPDLTKAEIRQASVAAAADQAIRNRISLYGEQAQITKQLIAYMREYYGVEQRSMTQGIQVGQTMKQIAAATIQTGIAAEIYGKSIGQAMKAAAKAVLASVAEQSAVEAIFYLAKGIGDSFWNPPAAAAEFHAAEMFGALAAGTGVAAAAIPGGGSAKARGGAGSQDGGSESLSSRGFSVGSGPSGQQLVPGGNLPEAPKNGNLTISIMGDQEAGQWLANTLNTVVRQGGASLTATHTTAIPNPVA